MKKSASPANDNAKDNEQFLNHDDHDTEQF